MTKKKTGEPSEDRQFIALDDPSSVFTTYDLGCTAALTCVGFELLSLGKENPRKALFVLRREDKIEETANLYFADKLEIKARSFFDSIKAVKNRLYSE